MKKFLLAMLTMTLMGPALYADLSRGAQTVAIFGGAGGSDTPYDFQPGDKKTVTGGGGAFGGQYLYYLAGSPAIAIGADINSSLNGNHRSDDTIIGYDSTARVKSLIGLVIARLSYPHGPLRPYIFAGVGAHDSSQQFSAEPQSGVTWPGGGTESRMLIDERETSAALGYGIGLDIFPTESFFFGVELRETWLAGLNTDDTLALQNAGIHADETQDINQGNVFFRAGVKF